MPRLLTLQAARGLAANLVLLSHLYLAGPIWTAGSVLPAFTYYGMAGVDLFFVLSGFIMVAVAGRNVGPLQFIWRRAARIYPTYWLASLLLLSSVVAHALMHSTPLDLSASLWRSLLLVPQEQRPLLEVGWTLVYEIYFYLVFTLFLALRIPVIVGLVAWAAVVFGGMSLATFDHLALSPVLQVVMNPLTAEFMFGAAIGVLWRNRRLPAARFAGLIGLAAAALSIGYIAPTLPLAGNPHSDVVRVFLFGVPAALILYGLAGAELRAIPPALPALLVKLGDWSYATYLTHTLVVLLIGKALMTVAPGGGLIPSVLLVLFGLIAANSVGAVVHVFFERPTLRWLHRLGTAFAKPQLQADGLATKTAQSV